MHLAHHDSAGRTALRRFVGCGRRKCTERDAARCWEGRDAHVVCQRAHVRAQQRPKRSVEHVYTSACIHWVHIGYSRRRPMDHWGAQFPIKASPLMCSCMFHKGLSDFSVSRLAQLVHNNPCNREVMEDMIYVHTRGRSCAWPAVSQRYSLCKPMRFDTRKVVRQKR